MNVFWALAGLLVLVSMLFVMPPLLRKPRLRGVQRDALNVQVIKDQLTELRADLESGRLDQAAYVAARHDIERELLEDVETQIEQPASDSAGGRWLAIVLVLLVPALAISIYQRIGAQALIERFAAGGAEVASTPTTQHSLDSMVMKLAERMQKEPDNVEGWSLLGRSYAALNRPSDALTAYRHALQLSPEDPEIISSYADAMIMANKGEFSDEVGQLLDKALTADPRYPKALWLRGHWKFRHSDYNGAIADWRTVMAELQPDDENVATIQEQIKAAQGRLGQPLDDVIPTEQKQAGSVAAGSGSSIQVHVTLDAALAAKAAPDDTVFIFARAVQGPRMPLAIVRKRVADLPADVTLDDSLAMSPAMVLSKFNEVTVGARVSKSGQAIPSSGDLQGMLSPVKTDGAQVAVTIDQVVP